MSHFISFTGIPITLTGTGTGSVVFSQPLWDVIDVSMIDYLDVELGIPFLSSGLVAAFSIQTAMQNQVDAGNTSQAASGTAGDQNWLAAGSFASQTGSGTNQAPTPWQKINISPVNGGAGGSGLLRYARWSVTITGVAGAWAVTFFMRVDGPSLLGLIGNQRNADLGGIHGSLSDSVR